MVIVGQVLKALVNNLSKTFNALDPKLKVLRAGYAQKVGDTLVPKEVYPEEVSSHDFVDFV